MRHSIWFTYTNLSQQPALPDSSRESEALPEPATLPTASTRLRVRSLLAFTALLALFAATIEIVAGVINEEAASLVFGAIGICGSSVLIWVLARTRG